MFTLEDTRLLQSCAVEQGPLLKLLDRLGSSSVVKDKNHEKSKTLLTVLTNQLTDRPTDTQTDRRTDGRSKQSVESSGT